MQLASELLEADCLPLLVRRGCPVPAQLHSDALTPLEQRPRLKLANALDERARAGHVSEDEVGVHGRRVQLQVDGSPGQQRRQLGREPDLIAALDIEERLFSEAVTRDHESPLTLVPDSEREHALERMDELWTKVL